MNDPGLMPRLLPRPADDAFFLQGLLEGMAQIEASAYRALADLGAPTPNRIYTAGGGSRNPVWTAIRRRVVSPRIFEAQSSDAAYGAALLSLSASGEFSARVILPTASGTPACSRTGLSIRQYAGKRYPPDHQRSPCGSLRSCRPWPFRYRRGREEFLQSAPTG